MCTWQYDNYCPRQIIKASYQGVVHDRAAAHNNLPSGVVVNCSYVTPKAGQVVVILINTTNRNIWICQPLLAAKIYDVELYPWQYHFVLYREGSTIKVGFQPEVPPEVEGDLQVEVKVKEVPSEDEPTPPLPLFGPHPNTTKTTISMTRL